LGLELLALTLEFSFFGDHLLLEVRKLDFALFGLLLSGDNLVELLLLVAQLSSLRVKEFVISIAVVHGNLTFFVSNDDGVVLLL